MKEKEKARELMCKFNFKQNAESGDITFYQTPEESQRCALIAVDEILDDDMYDMSEDLFEKRILYWENVKKEIENYDTRRL